MQLISKEASKEQFCAYLGGLAYQEMPNFCSQSYSQYHYVLLSCPEEL